MVGGSRIEHTEVDVVLIHARGAIRAVTTEEGSAGETAENAADDFAWHVLAAGPPCEGMNVRPKASERLGGGGGLRSGVVCVGVGGVLRGGSGHV